MLFNNTWSQFGHSVSCMIILFPILANHQIRHQATYIEGCQPADCRWPFYFLRGNNILKSSCLRVLNPHKAKYIFWIHKWYSTDQGAQLHTNYQIPIVCMYCTNYPWEKKGRQSLSYTRGKTTSCTKGEVVGSSNFLKIMRIPLPKEPTGFTFNYCSLVTLSRLIL